MQKEKRQMRLDGGIPFPLVRLSDSVSVDLCLCGSETCLTNGDSHFEGGLTGVSVALVGVSAGLVLARNSSRPSKEFL
jgi:hypothetical protein